MASLITAETYLLLGTNMGDRPALLSQACSEIAREIGDIISVSAIYETAAWGNEDQPAYLNQVVLTATPLQPRQVLEKINAIEKKMGRIRLKKWAERLINIDILYYADRVIDEPELTIPHPHLPNRRFALIPLQEIAPGFIHPIAKQTTTELVNQTTDQLPVQLYQL